MSRAKPKFIIVLCEGPTDQIALEGLLDDLFDETQVNFVFQSGDLMTSYDRKRTKSKVGDVVKGAKASLKIKDKDILRVAFLTDSDGCYISDDVVEDPGLVHAVYEDDCIRYSNKDAIIKRNHQKRDNLNMLINMPYTCNKKIEFKIYYNSCNLDHVTGYKRNASNSDKINIAREFLDKYVDDLPGFVKFFADDSLTSGKTEYLESWEVLKNGYESLRRHSNLLVFILDNYEYLNDKAKKSSGDGWI